MRALLTPEIASRLGIVLFRPGTDVMPLFRQGRVLIENVPDHLKSLPSGIVPSVRQPLATDPVMKPFLTSEKVIAEAGGITGLEHWLERKETGCQWDKGKYHHHEMTIMRYHTGAVRLCWACDTELREQSNKQVEELAQQNVCEWVTDRVRFTLGFDESHAVTLPELCWWATRFNAVDALPEGVARKSLRMPQEIIRGVTKETDLVPPVSATSIVHEKVKAAYPVLTGHLSSECLDEQSPEKKIVSLVLDTESPESFMKIPKRRRWRNEKYTRWVKNQRCLCCDSPADDPHHLTGNGLGGMATKAHDLFVIPLCRKHHDELHADTPEFEKRYGSQPELLIKHLDRTLAVGVLA